MWKRRIIRDFVRNSQKMFREMFPILGIANP